jgi:hypothetical protein
MTEKEAEDIGRTIKKGLLARMMKLREEMVEPDA